ncbi:MAG: iron-containing alcohol dehydrogenase [Bacteroidota bacterium]
MLDIQGQTNVTSLRIGAGAMKHIGQEIGRFIVATMEIPWKVSRDFLGANPESVLMIETMEVDWLDKQLARFPACDTFVGIGGGMAVDAAKYFAWKRGLRLVSIPTILSVDAFVTPAAGIRKDHEVLYVGETSPDPLIIDYDVIRTAPPELNIAGIGDLFSMYTASYDWEHAEKMGQSEYPFSAADVARARAILQELYSLLPEVRNTTDRGLRAIVEGYMKLNTICLPAGHYRVEEGSEHYLFYELEERLKRPFIHGNIVGLGIYLMSKLQKNQPEFIIQVMDEVGLNYHPSSMQIQRGELLASLLNLRSFVNQRPKLWYTCINDSDIDMEWAEAAIAGLRF